MASVLKVAVGHSLDPDESEAIQEVLEQCQRTLAGEIPQAGFLLTTIHCDHALVLEAIYQVFPDIQLIGGTADGEVSSVHGFQQDSVTLTLFASDQIHFQTGVGHNLSQNPLLAAQQAIEMAQATDPKLCLTLPESLTTSGAEVVASLRQVLGDSLPIVGGTAADDWSMAKTYQFFGREVLTDSLPVLFLSGPLAFAIGVESGWMPVGKPGTVTRGAGNIVYEIDGQPACQFYEHYIGKLTPSLGDPLAVMAGDGDTFYLRAIKSFDRTSGEIHFMADIPEQARVQLTEVSRDGILSASKKSFQKAMQAYPGHTPDVALLFSCAARKKLLGTKTKEEYQLVQDSFERPIPCCGFYTYGEIAPLDGHSQFHNETFVTLLLGMA